MISSNCERRINSRKYSKIARQINRLLHFFLSYHNIRELHVRKNTSDVRHLAPESKCHFTSGIPNREGLALYGLVCTASATVARLCIASLVDGDGLNKQLQVSMSFNCTEKVKGAYGATSTVVAVAAGL